MSATPATAMPSASTLDALGDALSKAEQATAPRRVDVPELGVAVHVRPLSTDEWLDPEAMGKLPDTATERQKRGHFVARWLCDESGQRLFHADNLACSLPVFDRFGALPFQASQRILAAAGGADEGAPKNG